MMPTFAVVLIVILLASYAAKTAGHAKAIRLIKSQNQHLASVPSYYGLYALLWCALPSLAFAILWAAGQDSILALWLEHTNFAAIDSAAAQAEISKIISGKIPTNGAEPWIIAAANQWQHWQSIADQLLIAGTSTIAIICAFAGYARIKTQLKARQTVDFIFIQLLRLAAILAVFVTFGILLSLAFEALQFFQRVSWFEFIFGLNWSPQTAIRDDQIGSSGGYGAIPVFMGTILITMLAMLVALPIGLMSAIYLTEYAHPKTRAIIKPAIEILAGIPTVVYGFFAALLIGPALSQMGISIGFDIDAESALAAGLTMGIMLIPFVSSLSDDVLHAVPTSLHDGSLALGATQSETIKKVIIPAALPGIVGACLLAFSRAIGETMIVVMAAGLAAKLTMNPFSSVTTVTVQIVSLLTGDQEFGNTTTLAAFALGLVLFAITLCLNFIALWVVRQYREKYE